MNNLELVLQLKAAVRREREATADVLRLLREVERRELFQKLLDRKAHSNFERKFETLFVSLAKEELNKIEKPNAPFLVPDKVRRRHIPAATRRVIWKRDQARCQFVSPTGQHCTETHGLQLDHIKPFALGGPSSPENLRLLCGAHNRWRNSG